jgi:two-component system chemotaxis response regulator CheY
MRKNVLLVDDSSTARKIVRIYLKEKGFHIIEAENGLEALEKMAYSDVDMIITDLNMPMMNGMELISYVKRDIKSKDIPIIIITTEKEEDEKEKSIESGALAYIKKPFKKNVLLQELNKALKTTKGRYMDA